MKSKVDFPLTGTPNDDIFVKIACYDGSYIALNVNNDPFITINDLPFGKKSLSNGDTLKIGNQEILLQIKEEVSQKEVDALFAQLDTLEEPEIPDEKPAETPTAVETVEDKIDLSEAVPLMLKPVSNPAVLTNVRDTGIKLPPSKRNPTRWVFTAFAALLVLCCISIFGYRHITSKNVYESRIAAEGIADVAMALAHAQVHHLTPQKQNWSDPEFLKNNLSAILSAEYPSLANIDSQGHFKKCPYILRVYTSNDLSQFLVIAQPEASFLQSLLNNEALAVSSTHMEIRAIEDLRALNRLLVSANTLDASNSEEIAKLVQETGQVIPLTELGSKQGFVPPKAIALLRPGAENFVYNAPRYYYFGESLLKRASALANASTSNPEVIRLQQQLADLSRFHHLILYSSHGLQRAMEAQSALNKIAPHLKFLMAYLNLDHAGNVTGSHLLLDGEHTKNSTNIALEGQHESDDGVLAMTETREFSGTTVIDNASQAPLLKELLLLSYERKMALQPISDRMIELLKQNTDKSFSEFTGTFYDLLIEYEQVCNEEEEKIANRIVELHHEYDAVTEEVFADYIKQAKLEP